MSNIGITLQNSKVVFLRGHTIPRISKNVKGVIIDVALLLENCTLLHSVSKKI